MSDIKIARIVKLYKSGKSTGEIAVALKMKRNKSCRQAIRRALRSKKVY